VQIGGRERHRNCRNRRGTAAPADLGQVGRPPRLSAGVGNTALSPSRRRIRSASRASSDLAAEDGRLILDLVAERLYRGQQATLSCRRQCPAAGHSGRRRSRPRRPGAMAQPAGAGHVRPGRHLERRDADQRQIERQRPAPWPCSARPPARKRAGAPRLTTPARSGRPGQALGSEAGHAGHQLHACFVGGTPGLRRQDPRRGGCVQSRRAMRVAGIDWLATS